MDASLASGDLIALADGDTRAVIAPGLGANCLALERGGRPVLEPVSALETLVANPGAGGCPVLFPFPGRVAGGRYRFDGRDYQLPVTQPDEGTHLHGFALRHPWRVVARDAAACTLAFDQSLLSPEEARGYPWPFAVTLRWRVGPGLLRADVRVENTGRGDLPFGFGLHPYLAVAPDAVVRVPTAELFPIAAGMRAGAVEPAAGPWPWAALQPGASLLLTGLPPGEVEATAGETAVRFPGDRFGEVVVYRPPERASVCVEPWTSVAGAANQLAPGAPHGLVRLPPGARWDAWVEIGGRRAAG
jgi:aldose 1-epimerase